MGATAREILDAVDAKLKVARTGLSDMRLGPQQFEAGLWNAAIFGRNATFTLQNLKTVVEGFDQWYKPKQEQMRADPEMAYMVEYRNKLEKAVPGRPISKGTININPGTLKQLGPPPPNALNHFVGDHLGGSGWDVMMPDGSIEQIYVAVPKETASFTVHLPESPGGRQKSAEQVVDEYLTKLEALAQEARKKFLP